MGKLFVISGSSGVGKGTLIKEFLSRHPDFKLSVSCTTRTPRHGCISENFWENAAEFCVDIYPVLGDVCASVLAS